ncbi:MAG: GNAT family N-acetyltransferase [Clostridia bacterium]|nr:GNAT family N-acetyltransferase [Clostridia bacterium]
MTGYVCRIPSREEMEKKWEYEISLREGAKRKNWEIWKKSAMERAALGQTLPYYGFLDGEIIAEATAALDPAVVENSAGLVDATTAYLFAFRTVDSQQGKGYFSKLFRYMLEDLKARGYKRATLGVEPDEIRNKAIYAHYGFTDFIKRCVEYYPDGTEVAVEYFGRNLE